MIICPSDQPPQDQSIKLALTDIYHRFGSTPIFDGLNLMLEQGKVAAIVGASGVGKTTLFNIAAGLIYPEKGRVWIDGQDCTGQPGQVGYMLQKDLLLPFKTVYDNIVLPLKIQGKDDDWIKKAVEPKLPLFGLSELVNYYPHKLSGGQRQRAALLRTYLSNDHLMLLDEPFSALDFMTKSDMYDWFVQFSTQLGLTCLIITHDIDEAIYLSDHVYVLKGSPADLTHHFTVPRQQGFLLTQEFLDLKAAIVGAIRDSSSS